LLRDGKGQQLAVRGKDKRGKPWSVPDVRNRKGLQLLACGRIPELDEGDHVLGLVLDKPVLFGCGQGRAVGAPEDNSAGTARKVATGIGDAAQSLSLDPIPDDDG